MNTVPNSVLMRHQPYQQLQVTWWGHMLWVVGAALLGWGCTASFAGPLHWSHPLFLVPYVLLTGVFLLA